MSYTIDQFGFQAVDQIPVEENDWQELLKAFMATDVRVIAKEFEGKGASNAASALRKAAIDLGIDKSVEIVSKKGTVYIQKAA